MNEFTDSQIKKITNRTILIYYTLMTVSLCGIGIMSFFALRMNWIIWYIAIICLLHIVWMIVIIGSSYKLEKSFVPFYYIFMTIYMFPCTLTLWQVQAHSIMLFYTLFPLLIFSRLKKLKSVIYASLSSMLFIVTIILIANRTDFLHIAVATHFIAYINLFIALVAIVYIILFTYFSHEISKLKNNQKSLAVEQNKKEREAEIAKLEELYNNVIVYFEKERPYRRQNYRLPVLAAELNTSTKYLSEAINTCYGGTFGNLLNKYRLEFVKKMLDNGLADKYTMEHIYTSAGYSSRAAFYENFHKAFDMSPLDYQKIQKSKTSNV